jgi:hypothetical protein
MEDEKKDCPNKVSSSARLTEVIEVTTTWGNGTKECPFQAITEFWTKDGKFLGLGEPIRHDDG